MDQQQLIQAELQKAGTDPLMAERLRRLELRRITPDKHIPQRRFLFRMFGKPCFPRGELVAVTGRAKSGKTFLTSILMSLCINTESLSIRRIEADPLHLLWFDTEQSEESTQEILRDRVLRMCNDPQAVADFLNGHCDVFNVRADFWQDRMPLLEAAILQYRPDLVILDGIRDLVNDINDGVLSQEIIERLMHLASQGECCIVCVLHQNKASEDKNLRGWIGTELTYKSFEVYECEKDAERRSFSWKQVMTRKYDILDTFRFTVNDQGLPELFSDTVLATASKTAVHSQPINREYMTNGDVNIVKVFSVLIPDNDARMRAYELEKKFRELTNIESRGWYGRVKNQALEELVIEKITQNEDCVYYRRGPRLRAVSTEPGGQPAP